MGKKKEHKNKARARIWAEYLLVRLVGAVVQLLPERAAILVGRVIGCIAWKTNSDKRRLARKNILKAMPGLPARKVDRMVRRVFTNLALTAVETLWWMKRTNKAKLAERFPVTGLERVREELAKGRPILAFTLHLGNWELFGSVISSLLGGLTVAARSASNPLINAYLGRCREQAGIRAIDVASGIRPLVAAMKAGHLTGMLIDQHVRTACVPAKFFGREAATTTVPASLALRFDAAVFFAYSFREGDSFRHRGSMEPLTLVQTGDRQADVLTNTQLFNDRIEEVVRGRPEQWLWTYRRWRAADKVEKRDGPAEEDATLVE